MNKLLSWAKRPAAAGTRLPAWLFEPFPLSASADERLQQRREIQALVRRAHAARSVS